MAKCLVIVKTDAFERKLVGYCIAAVEAQGTIEQLYHWTDVDRESWEEHYAEHKGRDYYDNLIDFMAHGPVLIMEVTVRDLKAMRTSMMQVRRMMHCDGPANLLHCSDSPESAARELALWLG